jgi:ATP-dependent Clp protease ATP-binding subunit ClpX
MARTLARVLQVPFSMSDCTPLTQAGYIGEDAQVCVERLLAAANYDVEAAENGIIVLDEVDKIAVSRTANGKDVGGEGVQQALLKIIEGTTVYIQAKNDKSSPKPSNQGASGTSAGSSDNMYGGKYPSSSTGSGGSGPASSSKGETYTVRTDNILFVFTGAFIGLNKIILDRVAKGSIGFGSPLRSAGSMNPDNSEMLLSLQQGSEESKIFEKNLPFFTQSAPGERVQYNPLDLVEPADLQKFGLIPEFTGRIPVTVALSALDQDALVRVLTEPRNSLVKQYEQILQLSGIELRFTSGALREIAKSSMGMGTGARGLRTCIERLLAEAMFEAPGKLALPQHMQAIQVTNAFCAGSSIKHILITEAVARKQEPPIYLPRGQQHKFDAMYEAEEEAWQSRHGSKDHERIYPEANTFEEYRHRSKAAGVM